MADNHTTNHLWQEMPSNLLLASQTRTPSEQNSENITKADFNREVHVDIRSIANESDQARHYEIPEAVEINEDENQEHSNDELIIVDARPLPWYIRIDFWKLCVIAILIVSAFAVAIVLLSKNLSSSSTSDINLPIEPHDAPTSFPTYVITTLPTYEPSFKTSTQSDKEYIAMQRDVLKQYYIETDGENSWYRTENWLNDEVSVCKWYGCECNNIDIDIITSFDMPGMLNPQQIPTVIGMLSKLEVLTIDGGSFVGTLPSELFRLHQLKRMKVISSIEGMLPSEIDELRSLEYLELRENRFDGQIPTELGLLQSLTYLDISDHKYFTEPTIPSELGNLSSLKKLYISHNGLRGTLPSELFGLVSLEELNLSWNSLSGSLPMSMELDSLREMDLSNNKLSGMLPGALGSLEFLEVLKINFNRITSIEPGLLSTTSRSLSSRLSFINLQHNRINSLPTDYVRLPSLSHFDVSFNKIEGSLPMFQKVDEVFMHVNSFHGSIPTEYGLLENLTEIYLDYNLDITGTVPTELVECDKLTLLSFLGTQISGNVTFCDSFGDDILIRVINVSICGEECECCCETLF